MDQIIYEKPVTTRAIAQKLFEDYSQDPDPYKIEKTLAIIKPDGIEYFEDIKDRIFNVGFQIVQSLNLRLTFEQASEFYHSDYGTADFPMKVVALSSGPIIVLCLSKIKAIKYWKILMGPENVMDARILMPNSLRALYGSTKNYFHNLLHGSANKDKARFEIKFFFPNMVIEPIPQGAEAHCFLQRYVNPLLFKGIHMIAKTRPDEPILTLAKFLLTNNPNKPLILSAVQCDLDKLEKCLQDCIDVNCLRKSKEFDSISECTTINVDEVSETSSKKEHDPDLIGRCLQCPHCAKILRIIYCSNTMDNDISDDLSQSCAATPSTLTVDVVIPSTVSLNVNSCVNCAGCNEVFIIRGNLIDKKPKASI